MSSAGEERNLIEPDVKSYRTRWWIMILSSLHFAHQNVGLNTWGPIAQSSKALYDWEDTTISFILNMGRVGSLLFLPLGCFLLDKKGLRVSMVVYAIMMTLSNSLRCLARNKDIAIWVVTFAEAMNGSNGVITFAGPAVIASTWFPQRERITATAVTVLGAYIGDGLSSILGPLVVEYPVYNTSSDINSSLFQSNGNMSYATTEISIPTVLRNEDAMVDGLMLYLYIQCGVSVLLLLATLLYFPAKPPSTPSHTAGMKRIDYKEAFAEIRRRKWLCLLLLVFGLIVGMYTAWICIIDIVFDPLNVTQVEVGWIGFYTITGGAVAGFVIARISDIFAEKLKTILICLYVMIIILKLWTALLASQILPFDFVQLNISSVIGGALINASFPLIYELMCEMAFPLPEGVINGIVDALFLIFANGFYIMMYYPVKDYTWLPWILLSCCVIVLLMMLIYPVKYTRTRIDMDKQNGATPEGFNMEVIKDWEK